MIDKKSLPLVSVIMGIYNCEHTLAEALESILNQTWKNWELILYDDGSTDGTFEMAKMYADRDSRIHLMHGNDNRKLSYALNQCLRNSSGEYIARMDGDDISHPDRFEKQITYLETHPQVHLVGTQMNKFDESGYIGTQRAPLKPVPEMLRGGVPIFHATIMARRSVFDALGGYTESEAVEGVEDLDLWFRFFERGYKAINIDEVLYDVRMDQSAVKRRTLKRRIRSIKTRAAGYKRLGFPRRWIIKPAIILLMKGFTPTWIRRIALKGRIR